MISLYRFDDIGNQIVTPFELYIDTAPGFIKEVAVTYQPVIHDDHNEQDHNNSRSDSLHCFTPSGCIVVIGDYQ
jgi:hypothetical protein